MLPRTVFVGREMKFQVLNRELASTVVGECPYVSISITNPKFRFAKLADSPHRKAILQMRFEDYPLSDPDFDTFDESYAHRILDFYEAHRQEIDLVIVNCEMGINRSSAVAAALSQIANGTDTWFFDHFEPNRLVYDTLLAVHKQRLDR